MEEKQVFDIELDNGIVKRAAVMQIIVDNNKRYIIYSIDNQDGTADIMASYLIKDSAGYDELQDITDPTDRKHIDSIVKNVIYGNTGRRH